MVSQFVDIGFGSLDELERKGRKITNLANSIKHFEAFEIYIDVFTESLQINNGRDTKIIIRKLHKLEIRMIFLYIGFNATQRNIEKVKFAFEV